MPEPISLEDIASVFNRITNADWSDEGFSYDKAYVCSVFSAWAYAAINAKEKKAAVSKRIRVFKPSYIYDELILDKKKFDFQAFMAKQNLERREGEEQRAGVELLNIYRTEFVVIVTFKLKGMIFIAIRGTDDFQDKLVDLNALKILPWNWHFRSYGYHPGFYHAIRKYPIILHRLLHKWSVSNALIYVTGHSLGGALSAILFEIWNGRHPSFLPRCLYKIHSAYTFGMPRYANRNTMRMVEWLYHPPRSHPYHVLNPWDIIPRSPPKKMGYADSKFRYSSVSALTLSNRKRWGKGTEWPHHAIEYYIRDIAEFV
jgi:hypothetical protein